MTQRNEEVVGFVQTSGSPFQLRKIKDADGLNLLEKRVNRKAPLWAILCLDRDFLISKRLHLDVVLKSNNQDLNAVDFYNTWELPHGSFYSEMITPIPSDTVNLKVVLERMIHMTKTLGTLHAAGLVHGGIYPGAWFFSETDKQWKLMNLGLSFYPSRESTPPINFLFFEELIPYLSPEQTGRTGRSVDPRSDLYSLGVLFYELLSGAKPYGGTDKMELIHSHIAINAPKLEHINTSIPSGLSRVIAKLLAKDPNDRYRSTLGLRYDLEQILHGLESGINLQDMQPGKRDISDRIQVSTKIFGRKSEIENIFQNIPNSGKDPVTFILINGKSGIGRSAFLKEIKIQLELKKYLIGSAGFSGNDQYIPMSGILEVFKDLIRRILSENDSILTHWKELLKDVLGGRVAYLAEILPGIEKILGAQPFIPEALPKESEDRLTKALIDFLSVFTFNETPLIILLDDLQYADPIELRLLETLCLSGRIRNLCIIACTKTDHEINEFSYFIQRLKEGQSACFNYTLEALSKEAVAEFLSDAFGQNISAQSELAAVFMNKTDGIPLLLQEFLQNANQAGYFKFSSEEMNWQWEIESLQSFPLPETVANILLFKLESVSPASMKLLEIAAIVGETFGFKDLQHLLKISEIEVANLLHEVIFLGLVNQLPTGKLREGIFIYSFAHPSIQIAILERISSERKSQLNFEHSQFFLQIPAHTLSREQLLQLAGHIHASILHWKEKGDMLDYIKGIMLEATKKCRKVFSYDLADLYIADALNLLNEESWKRNHALAFNIYLESIKCLFLNGKQPAAIELFEKGTKWENSREDKVKRYMCMVLLHTHESEAEKALNMAKLGLAALGIHLPSNPNQWHVFLEIISTQISLGLNPIKKLRAQKANSNPEALLISELIFRSFAPANSLNKNLLVILSLKALQLYTKYGLNPFLPSSLTMYGFVVSNGFGNFKKGFEFIKLANEMSDQLNDPFAIGSARYALGLLGTIMLPLRDLKKPMEEALLNFDICGDLYLASACTSTLVGNQFQLGVPLQEIEENLIKLIDFSENAKDVNTIILHRNLKAQIQLLQSRNDVTELNLASACQHLDRADKSHKFWSHFYQMLLCYLVNEDKLGLIHAEKAKIFLSRPLFLMENFVYFYYDSLLLTRKNLMGTEKEKAQTIKLIRQNYRMLKPRGKKAPLSYGHLLEGIKACEHMLHSQYFEAFEALNRALDGLRAEEYYHDRGIFLNLQAEICIIQGNQEQASKLLKQAYISFQTWGAEAVCYILEKKYPEIQFQDTKLSIITESENISHQEVGRLQEDPNIKIDLSSVLKASQTISTEIELPKLLKKLLEIIMQNAGATRGVLLMPIKGQLCVMAEESSDMKDLKILQKIPTTHANSNLPQTLINYVTRTKELVSLDDASNSDQFGNDPYIHAGHLRSVMALPVLKQGEVMLIMYLENSLTAGVFTKDRVSILEMLSGQIGISIENATLFEHVSKINKAYERFVPYEFLDFLGKESILEVGLGDHVQREMTVLFADIRGFTAMSEKMTPEENFTFINRYLSVMEPVIRKHNGFIDKYIGDGLMALFPKNATDAVQAALSMSDVLDEFNLKIDSPIEFGIGINWGNLMLGTVGGVNRMDGTVISDTVNVAARIEQLTKEHKTRIIITEAVYSALPKNIQMYFEQVGVVNVRGRVDVIPVYKVKSNQKKPPLKTHGQK